MRQSSRKTLAVWAPQAESVPAQPTVPLAGGGQGHDGGVKAEDCGVLAVSTGCTGGASSGQVAAESPSPGLAWHTDASGPSLRGLTLGAWGGVECWGPGPSRWAGFMKQKSHKAPEGTDPTWPKSSRGGRNQ